MNECMCALESSAIDFSPSVVVRGVSNSRAGGLIGGSRLQSKTECFDFGTPVLSTNGPFCKVFVRTDHSFATFPVRVSNEAAFEVLVQKRSRTEKAGFFEFLESHVGSP